MNFSSLVLLAASVFALPQQESQKAGFVVTKQLNKGSWPWGLEQKSVEKGASPFNIPIPFTGPLWNGQFPWMCPGEVCAPSCC